MIRLCVWQNVTVGLVRSTTRWQGFIEQTSQGKNQCLDYRERFRTGQEKPGAVQEHKEENEAQCRKFPVSAGWTSKELHDFMVAHCEIVHLHRWFPEGNDPMMVTSMTNSCSKLHINLTPPSSCPFAYESTETFAKFILFSFRKSNSTAWALF